MMREVGIQAVWVCQQECEEGCVLGDLEWGHRDDVPL
jgi:hypothetical protein